MMGGLKMCVVEERRETRIGEALFLNSCIGVATSAPARIAEHEVSAKVQ
jgi:hypothetical protein